MGNFGLSRSILSANQATLSKVTADETDDILRQSAVLGSLVDWVEEHGFEDCKNISGEEDSLADCFSVLTGTRHGDAP